MKKILVLCLAVFSLSIFPAKAQVDLGVKGSFNYTSLELGNTNLNQLIDSKSGYNVGLALRIDLPLGFAIQPEVTYSKTGSKMEMDLPLIGKQTLDVDLGCLEVPVGLQWGIQLGPVRPFVQCVPYLNFTLSNAVKLNSQKMKVEKNSDFWSDINGGIGVGFGLDVWKFQLSCRYKWDLGNIMNFDGKSFGDVASEALSTMKDESKMSGVELSLAFFF
ncbi:MAG: PorT family protein [Bacteroidales bacterium]|nr:PorT family protein [Bacteroidales bacterium]